MLKYTIIVIIVLCDCRIYERKRKWKTIRVKWKKRKRTKFILKRNVKQWTLKLNSILEKKECWISPALFRSLISNNNFQPFKWLFSIHFFLLFSYSLSLTSKQFKSWSYLWNAFRMVSCLLSIRESLITITVRSNIVYTEWNSRACRARTKLQLKWMEGNNSIESWTKSERKKEKERKSRTTN